MLVRLVAHSLITSTYFSVRVGFIDISQSTRNVCFMTPLTAKGLEISTPGDGTLKIEQEGKVKKFVNNVFETTFSGSEAVRRGQQVYYVTERAVFKRTAKYDVLQLVEIAPGIDLRKDVLDQMEFVPEISPDLMQMDSRIFRPEKMGVTAEMFGTLEERCTYHSRDNTMFIDLFGITLNTDEDIDWFDHGLRSILGPIVSERGKIHVIAQYDGFDLRKGLETKYSETASRLEKEFYASIKRYSGASFRRAKLGQLLRISDWDPEELYRELDEDKSGQVSTAELRKGIMDKFSIHLTRHQISKFKRNEGDDFVDRDLFIEGIEKALKSES
jgi:propionate CoA-transferase